MSLTIHGARYFLSLVGNITQPLEWVWVALSQDEIGYTATGDTITEPSAPSYHRVQLGNASGTWGLVGTTLTNLEDVVFPQAEEDWGLIRAWAICDANESGNVLIEGTLDTPVTISEGGILTVPASGLSVAFDIDRWVL